MKIRLKILLLLIFFLLGGYCLFNFLGSLNPPIRKVENLAELSRITRVDFPIASQIQQNEYKAGYQQHIYAVVRMKRIDAMNFTRQLETRGYSVTKDEVPFIDEAFESWLTHKQFALNAIHNSKYIEITTNTRHVVLVMDLDSPKVVNVYMYWVMM